ncbi:RND superfamily putative drug exporter [Kibdelosporangium banguiense]|uniref:RND superfamily putative drug exporter n=1 Tax=Kibdelosporangium banguiense TaxID=1365924 RepID=A0ABS4TMB6_9PSEU|nr:MMPL family transporter [Kibdelosporangium banguiense]MBP2325548.1 RND superfamily putative drug exporter [Kibdelosporangium banguiense]
MVLGERAARAVAAVCRTCVRYRLVVIGAWVLLVLALVMTARVIGTPTDNDVSLPGTDAQLVRDLTASSATPLTSGTVIVVARDGRLDDGTLVATAASLWGAEHVTTVKPPSPQEGSLSADGRTGWFTVGLDVRRAELTKAMAHAVIEAAKPAADAGLRVLPGGALAQVIDGSGNTGNEFFGLILAALVLFLALGGLVGAALALLSAALSVLATLEIVGLAGNLTSMPAQASTLALMVGLGVGIDYSLFLLSRFRTLTRSGLTVSRAIQRAAADSGTAVVVAGVTVAVALAGLSLTEVPLLQTLAWTCGIAVLFAVLAALTLLPALTSLAGGPLARGGRLYNRLARRTGSGGFWARQADRVTRRPWLAGGSAVVLLVLLAAPATDLRLGQLDAGSSPEATAVRQANDAISAAFGPGAGTPLTVLGQLPTPVTGAQDSRVPPLVAMVWAQPGVAAVGPTTPSGDGRVVTVQVIASTSGGDPATADLVHRLRSQSVPGMTVHVGGSTAARVDLADRVTDKLPLVIGVVLLLSVAVLLFAFRAPLLALKAAVMDFISIGAAYGVLTAVFTWGWGVTWIGLSGPVPIPSFVPLMLFALLFGLSMDYEVFLLSDVQRRWKRTGDNLRSVREGLLGTGRVITAAAAIMVGVFLAFVPNNDPTIKMFGVGLAVAIAVDATVVRCLLVPATMAMLGNLNWWTPGRKRVRTAEPV